MGYGHQKGWESLHYGICSSHVIDTQFRAEHVVGSSATSRKQMREKNRIDYAKPPITVIQHDQLFPNYVNYPIQVLGSSKKLVFN